QPAPGREARGEPDDRTLQQAARLEHLPDGFTVWSYQHGQRLDERVHRDVADEGALSRPDIDEAPTLQRAQRLAHGGAAHHELLGKVALGRQPIAGLELPLADDLLELAHDLFVDARAFD